MRKPKVCFLSLNLYHLLTNRAQSEGIGGPEIQTKLMAEELLSRGYDVSVITLAFDSVELKEDVPFRLIQTFKRDAGIPLLRFYFPRLFSIWQALKKADADVYYVNNAGFLLAPVVRYARRYGKKVIHCGASNTDFNPKTIRQNTRDKILFYWALKRVDAIFVQNELQKNLLRTHLGRESRIVYNGFQIDVGNGTPGGNKVLWVAGIKKIKNPHLFVELARRMPDQQFVMIGGLTPYKTAELKEYYEEMMSRAHSLPNLEVTGHLPFGEADKRFAEAKVFVNTSDVEGLPNTFIQAWARGVPVVSFVGLDDKFETEGLGVVVKDMDDMTNTVRDIVTAKRHLSSRRIREFFLNNCTMKRMIDVLEETFVSIGA